MMTEEEWNNFEKVCESRLDPRVTQLSKYDNAIIAAYLELKERREDEEWMKRTRIHVTVTEFETPSGGRCLNGCMNRWVAAPTIHAAVTAARGGK
jgi:hypothetical protein